MNEPTFSISELAKRAGISVRTIRYYLNEGLLPQPQTEGRYSVYSPDYLDRLELIARLKESFLPLKEIRQRVSGLDIHQVRLILRELDESGEGQAAEKEDSILYRKSGQGLSSALEYLTRIKETQTKALYQPPPTRPGAPAPSGTALPTHTWERIELSDGVELHVRQPQPADTRSRIRQVIDFARKLFS
jgi:DNA-binding transcriptional MerR regulator